MGGGDFFGVMSLLCVLGKHTEPWQMISKYLFNMCVTKNLGVSVSYRDYQNYDGLPLSNVESECFD